MLNDIETAHRYSENLVIFCFLVAALATLSARRWGYSVFYLLAAAEIYVDYRYVVKFWFKDALEGVLGSVENQRIFQGVLLFVAAVIMVGIIARYLSRRKKPLRGERLLWFGTLFVLFVFALDAISLHQIDTFIYAYDGFLLRAAGMMCLGALIATWGAWRLRKAGRRDSAISADAPDKIMWPTPVQE